MELTDHFNTGWRKVASTIYKKPSDSKIFGGVEIDVTDLEEFISGKRKAGNKITLTHFFVMVLGRAVRAEIPEFNTFIKRGKVVSRKGIDVAVSVLQANGDMSSVIVQDADHLTFEGIESLLNEKIAMTRGGGEAASMHSKNILARIPWPIRPVFFKLYKLLTLNWGISIPGLGLTANNSGSFLITNIGSLGLDYGFPALLPTSTFSFVLVMGGIQKKPVVIRDEIVIRRMMSLSIVIDHRIADASHGARLFRFIKNAVRNPGSYCTHLQHNVPEESNK